MLRTAIERLSRRVVVKRRLPRRFGGTQIYISPDAALQNWHFDLEHTDPRLFNWVSELVKQDDVVWDVGANVGLFAFPSAYMAGPKGRIIAIEADIWLADLLRRSVHFQPATNAEIEILPLAVSKTIDLARFNIANRGRCANHLEDADGSTQTGGVRETVTVMTVTLDWLLERLPAPRVLKIDVEGAEHLVLGGATRLLTEARPTILCEVGKENAGKVSALLQVHGYTLYDLEIEKEKRVPIKTAAFNTLALSRAT